jgi:RNA polymerase subunit RPABC4/transcription elongation factor Spt4
MQEQLQEQNALAGQHSNLCPKCGSELRVSWCATCFGTGRSGKHECKKCGGTGRTMACPNVHSHKRHTFEFWRGRLFAIF